MHASTHKQQQQQQQSLVLVHHSADLTAAACRKERGEGCCLCGRLHARARARAHTHTHTQAANEHAMNAHLVHGQLLVTVLLQDQLKLVIHTHVGHLCVYTPLHILKGSTRNERHMGQFA